MLFSTKFVREPKKLKLKDLNSILILKGRKGVCGGEPVIRHTRITVALITGLEKVGYLADEIVGMYPHINHAQVFDALSYYYDNKDEIDQLIAANDIDYWQKETRHDPWRK